MTETIYWFAQFHYGFHLSDIFLSLYWPETAQGNMSKVVVVVVVVVVGGSSGGGAGGGGGGGMG